jgi:hypothetical protein
LGRQEAIRYVNNFRSQPLIITAILGAGTGLYSMKPETFEGSCQHCNAPLRFWPEDMGKEKICGRCFELTPCIAPPPVVDSCPSSAPEPPISEPVPDSPKKREKRTRKPGSLQISSEDWEEMTEQQKELEITESEYAMDIGDWKEIYPWLTWKRVQEAARLLDRRDPKWRFSHDVTRVIRAVIELHPEFLERKGVCRQCGRKVGREQLLCRSCDARSRVEMHAALAQGIAHAEPRTFESTTPTKLSEWSARDLSPAVQSFFNESASTARSRLGVFAEIRPSESSLQEVRSAEHPFREK